MQVSGNQPGAPFVSMGFDKSTGLVVGQANPRDAKMTPLNTAAPQPQSTSGGFMGALSNGWSGVVNTLYGLLSPPQTVVQLPAGSSGQTIVPVGGGSTPIGGGDNKPPVPIPPPDPTPTRQSLLPANVRTFDKDAKMEYIPSSKKDKKVALLLRTEHISKAWGVKSMKILSADGTQVLSTGRIDGKDKDGKPIARFDKAASELPRGAIVVIEFENGQSRKLDLGDPKKGFTW